MLDTARDSMAIEKKNEVVRRKNEMDDYRDRLHRKLFNQLKTILYDDKDPRFDNVQIVMNVVKDVGIRRIIGSKKKRKKEKDVCEICG